MLMTVYNGLPYIRQAIDSVLNQTYTNFEFLIINDCSTDETREFILSYNDPRIRLVDNEENIKQTRSLNKGLRLASGDIIARLDADDLCHPTRLEMQVDFLHRNPDVAVVGSSIRYIDENGKVTGRWSRPGTDLALRWMQLFACPIGCGAAAFRKRVIWEELGGFDETISVPQDWELWSRVMQNHKVGSLQHFLVDVRRHTNCESFVQDERRNEESFRINRLNPKRVLGIEEDSGDWFRKLDSLRLRHVESPKDRIEVIGALFERFCKLYPEANSDSDVIAELVVQYGRALIHTRPAMLGQAMKCMLKQWPVSLRSFCTKNLFGKTIQAVLEWHQRRGWN